MLPELDEIWLPELDEIWLPDWCFSLAGGRGWVPSSVAHNEDCVIASLVASTTTKPDSSRMSSMRPTSTTDDFVGESNLCASDLNELLVKSCLLLFIKSSFPKSDGRSGRSANDQPPCFPRLLACRDGLGSMAWFLITPSEALRMSSLVVDFLLRSDSLLLDLGWCDVSLFSFLIDLFDWYWVSFPDSLPADLGEASFTRPNEVKEERSSPMLLLGLTLLCSKLLFSFPIESLLSLSTPPENFLIISALTPLCCLVTASIPVLLLDLPPLRVEDDFCSTLWWPVSALKTLLPLPPPVPLWLIELVELLLPVLSPKLFGLLMMLLKDFLVSMGLEGIAGFPPADDEFSVLFSLNAVMLFLFACLRLSSSSQIFLTGLGSALISSWCCDCSSTFLLESILALTKSLLFNTSFEGKTDTPILPGINCFSLLLLLDFLSVFEESSECVDLSWFIEVSINSFFSESLTISSGMCSLRNTFDGGRRFGALTLLTVKLLSVCSLSTSTSPDLSLIITKESLESSFLFFILSLVLVWLVASPLAS